MKKPIIIILLSVLLDSMVIMKQLGFKPIEISAKR